MWCNIEKGNIITWSWFFHSKSVRLNGLSQDTEFIIFYNWKEFAVLQGRKKGSDNYFHKWSSIGGKHLLCFKGKMEVPIILVNSFILRDSNYFYTNICFRIIRFESCCNGLTACLAFTSPRDFAQLVISKVFLSMLGQKKYIWL
jgi:hypothetical protein